MIYRLVNILLLQSSSVASLCALGGSGALVPLRPHGCTFSSISPRPTRSSDEIKITGWQELLHVLRSSSSKDFGKGYKTEVLHGEQAAQFPRLNQDGSYAPECISETVVHGLDLVLII